MSKKVTVDLDIDSPYIEGDTKFHNFKRRMTYRLPFKLIRKYLKKNRPTSTHIDILEIGVGSGYFAKFFLEQYKTSNYTGLEFDPRLIDVTKQKVPHANLVQGNAEEFSLDQEFDMVVSFQVLEHLYNPEAMIQNICDHLKPGGLLVVTTPNLNGFGASLMGKDWLGYRHDHVSLKGHDEWLSLIERNGFERSFSGSTFFTGLPWFNKMPLVLVNWLMLMTFGALKWSKGESFVGAFIKKGTHIGSNE